MAKPTQKVPQEAPREKFVAQVTFPTQTSLDKVKDYAAARGIAFSTLCRGLLFQEMRKDGFIPSLKEEGAHAA